MLIEPPFGRLFKDTYSLDRFPLSLGYLGGAIRENTDWEVMAYNADFTPRGEMIKVVGYFFLAITYSPIIPPIIVTISEMAKKTVVFFCFTLKVLPIKQSSARPVKSASAGYKGNM